MAIKMIKICAEVTSTYIEFTPTFGLKLEFKNTFKFIKQNLLHRKKSLFTFRTFVRIIHLRRCL